MTNDAVPSSSSSETMAKIVYVLYLLSIMIGFSGIVGVIIAYVYRADAPDWLQTHYQFQIRTFWIGALYALLGVLLASILIGWLILAFYLLWLIVRCVKGLKALGSRSAIADPQSWMF